jgi:hypothetical protein
MVNPIQLQQIRNQPLVDEASTSAELYNLAAKASGVCANLAMMATNSLPFIGTGLVNVSRVFTYINVAANYGKNQIVHEDENRQNPNRSWMSRISTHPLTSILCQGTILLVTAAKSPSLDSPDDILNDRLIQCVTAAALLPNLARCYQVGKNHLRD